MTQTAPPTVQLTLETMLAKFRDKHQDLIAPFEKIRPELEEGTGVKALANLISCEVDVATEQGFFVYSWTGQSSPFELRVPKPFNPHPQHSGEMQQQAQVQEAEAEPEPVPETTREGAEPATDPLAPEETAPPAENAPEAVETTPSGLFTALAALIGDSTLLMTLARTSEEGKEPVLTVAVVPQGEDAFTPVCLEGTVDELDTHFVSALTARAESKKSMAQQINALKAADKALEEAKKQEVAAKNKQTEAKKRATAKKEEEAKAEEAKVEDAKAAEKAEADKQQELPF